jgi:hypothetical protein
MRTIDELEDFEVESIIEDIEATYSKELLQPMEAKFIKFFEKVQNFEDGYRTHKPSKEIKLVSITYDANSRLSFVSVMACLDFYEEDYDIARPEIQMDSYDNYDVYELCLNILTKHNIDDEELDEHDVLGVWETHAELDFDFLLTCWQKAKAITNSNLYGFLEASDNSGGITNMDNGNFFSDLHDSIEKYLKRKGITIKKDAGL